ncbi:Pesticin receptor [Alphaproteobacteria bacterium SO-S41]|nr:Pesticin receptor [Alphaproteobacteria bacterium SO-S41]
MSAGKTQTAASPRTEGVAALLRTALCSTALAAALIPAALAQETPAPAQADEEVVVTADKRSEKARDVPSSISVVTAGTMRDRGLASIVDLTNVVAGLSVSSRGATGYNQIILRGVTSGGSQTSPTVAIYVDDVPFGTSSPSGSSTLQPDLDPADIARVEVLRGPQGTLYGASTLGGLIKYVTAAPDSEEFSARVNGGYRNVDGQGGGDGRIAVNAPIVKDKVGLRISGFYRYDPGFIDVPARGLTDTNSGHASGGRASLGIRLTDKVDLRLNAFTQKSHVNATGSVDLNPDTLVPIYGDLKNGRKTGDFFDNNYTLYSGTLTWDLGPVNLVSATGYGRIRSDLLLDITPAYGFITQLYSGGLLPAGNIFGPQNFKSSKFTQEIRFDSNSSGPFTWRLGGFYTKEDIDIVTSVLGYNPTTGALFPSLFGPLSTAVSAASYKEYAVFGDVRYAITDDLELSAGLRWAKNEQASTTSAVGLLISGSAPTTPVVTGGTSEESVVTYSASLKWSFSDDAMAYARVARGYRPGGPLNLTPSQLAASVPTSYDSDSVTNYEIGLKGLWLDGKLSAEAALFYIDWESIQLPTLIAGFNVLSNGGGAVSKGVELNLVYSPDEHWRFGFRGSYTDAYLTENAVVAGYAKDDRLPAVPQWDLGGDVEYTANLGGDLSGTLGASFKYNSDRATGQSQNALNPLRILPSFTTFDLYARLDWDAYSLSAYVRNVGDARGYYNGSTLRALAGQAVPYTAIPVQPQTFGITLSADF